MAGGRCKVCYKALDCKYLHTAGGTGCARRTTRIFRCTRHKAVHTVAGIGCGRTCFRRASCRGDNSWHTATGTRARTRVFFCTARDKRRASALDGNPHNCHDTCGHILRFLCKDSYKVLSILRDSFYCSIRLTKRVHRLEIGERAFFYTIRCNSRCTGSGTRARMSISCRILLCILSHLITVYGRGPR